MRRTNKYSIYVGIYPTTKVGEKGHVYFRITSNGKIKYLKTNIRATDDELTTVHLQQIVYNLKLIYCIIENLDNKRESYTLDDIRNDYDQIISGNNPYDERINSAGSNFEMRQDLVYIGGIYKNYYKEVKPVVNKDTRDSLFKFIDAKIAEFFNESRASSLSAYRSIKQSLSRFLENEDIFFKDVKVDLIQEYFHYLKQSGISDSTVAFYMRVLRRLFNQAADEGLLTLPDKAFANVDTSVNHPGTKSTEQYLTKEQMRQLALMKIEDNGMDFARDLFMFSYYMRGVELADLASLQESNIQGQYLIYNRRKFGKEIKTIIDPKAREIIDKYSGQNDDYLFPLLKINSVLAFTNVRNKLSVQLSQLGEMLKPQMNLSFSMAKATWIHLIDEANLASSLIK